MLRLVILAAPFDVLGLDVIVLALVEDALNKSTEKEQYLLRVTVHRLSLYLYIYHQDKAIGGWE